MTDKEFKRLFNELAVICAETVGLQEVVFVVSFEHDDALDGYDARLKSADYAHLYAEIVIGIKNPKERMLNGPESFAQLLMHEMLHYSTGAGTTHLDKQKDFFEYHMWGSDWATLHNAVMRDEEENTIRLDRAFLPVLTNSKEFKKWLTKIKAHGKERRA